MGLEGMRGWKVEYFDGFFSKCEANETVLEAVQVLASGVFFLEIILSTERAI